MLVVVEIVEVFVEVFVVFFVDVSMVSLLGFEVLNTFFVGENIHVWHG